MISEEDQIMMETLYWWGIPTLFRCKNDPDPKNCDIALVGVPHSTGNGTTERDQHLGPRAVRNISAMLRRSHLEFGIDHLVYGANSLFSSADVRASYLIAGGEVCRTYPRAAVQYQTYHGQSWLSGVESKLGLGLDCNVLIQGHRDRLGIEASALHNKELKSGRLGGDRQGWQINFAWQRQLGLGVVMFQYIHTRMYDEEGYSPLFAGGIERDEHRDSVYFQYRRPIPVFGSKAQILANVYYHSQRNTIDLFQTRGTSAEIGISWGF